MNNYIIRNSIVACATSLLLVGCGGPLPRAYTGETNTVNIPEVNSEATAEVGQTIISKANVTTSPGIILPKTVSEVVNYPGTTTVHAGSIPLFASNESGKFYRDLSATYTLLGSTVLGSAGIYVPEDKSKPPVIFHFAMHYIYGKQPVNGLKDTTVEKWGKDTFKRELVYSGVSQNTISILYREFLENMARPAFSQELKYDLSQERTIGFRGARFEVIKATNTEIRYKVIKPLE